MGVKDVHNLIAISLETREGRTLSHLKKPKIIQVWVRKTDICCYVVHFALKAQNSLLWYLDSGCSRHITGNKSLFSSIEKYDGGLVHFRDGNNTRVIGRGTMSIPGISTLDDVLLVDGPKENLLSINQLCYSRHEVHFSLNDCR